MHTRPTCWLTHPLSHSQLLGELLWAERQPCFLHQLPLALTLLLSPLSPLSCWASCFWTALTCGLDALHQLPLTLTLLFPPQLLGELLLDGINVRLMMRYVSDVRNLMLMMNLLKDNSRSIQFEAFHVFKVRSSQRPPRPAAAAACAGRQAALPRIICCSACCTACIGLRFSNTPRGAIHVCCHSLYRRHAPL